jgi:ribosomal protein L3 glutamine methyltransferase
MKLQELILEASNRLSQAKVSFGHGTDNSHDEASWLVLWSLGLPLDTDTTTRDETLTALDIERALELIDKRITQRIPSAYLTGEAWLQGVPFFIDTRSIIPRSLIAECLVNASIDPWLHERTTKVLDLCTGNGSLAIICAMVFPDVDIDAIDISVEALEIAQINIDRHKLGARIHTWISNGLQQARGPYDLIVCNPPYVNAQSMSELPPEFRAEPSLSLDGGVDGMDFIKEFLKEAPNQVSDIGVIVLEVGHERAHFEAAHPSLECVWLETSAGDEQIVLITKNALSHFMKL